METIINVRNLNKSYNLYKNSTERLKEAFSFKKNIHHQERKVLDNINFNVYKGETVGIIGTNGSGKSTLLKIITGVLSPSSGIVEINGKVSALLELGAGFNPEYTGIENIYLNGTMMKFTKQEIDRKLESIIKFADIGEYINQPVKTYSSGMFARLAFAVAINVEPDILIVDEALSVGDVFFQNKCFRKFEELREKGVTILFVSHDIESIKEMTSRVLWIEQGKQRMFDEKIKVCNAYLRNLLIQNNELASNFSLSNKEAYNIKKFNLSQFPTIKNSSENLLNDKVKILSCFFEDTSGNIVSELKVDNIYHLVILFHTKIDLNECIVGFTLQTKKGIALINMNTLNSGLNSHFIARENTTNRVEFSMEIPRFHTDEYIIDCAVANGRSVMDNTMLTWCYGASNIYIQNPYGNLAILDLDTNISIYSN